MSQFSWDNEWHINEVKEESFMVRNVMDKTPRWIRFVKKRVPKALQKTLDAAFGKAFYTVFDKGAIIIEKTYAKDKEVKLFRNNEKQMEQESFNKRAVRRFERQAKTTIYKNLVISIVEGIFFGLVGMGLPDIPIFVSVLLKSIYEISISYGFSYTSDKERLFILRLIETSLQSGNKLREMNEELDYMIDNYLQDEEGHRYRVNPDEIDAKISDAADALSHQLLYWKFIQGKAILGLLGGTADFSVLKRVTDYAVLKYKRRFLLRNVEQEY